MDTVSFALSANQLLPRHPQPVQRHRLWGVLCTRDAWLCHYCKVVLPSICAAMALVWSMQSKRTHARAHTHARTHARTQTRTSTNTHTRTHASAHKHAHAHTRAHAHAHKHKHIYSNFISFLFCFFCLVMRNEEKNLPIDRNFNHVEPKNIID